MKTSTGLEAFKIILDPIHGSIPITKLEYKIISTPVFQRLRYITQLGLTSLVFPGALHSRFLHSLGTVYVMDRLLSTLKEDLKKEGFYKEIVQIMRLAALLHDCGHMPFSHTFEHLSDIDHESIGSYVIKNSIISDILENNGFDSKIIGEIIRGNLSFSIEKKIQSNILLKLIPLIHSEIDVDRMDYLLRDSYFTGVPFGNIDIERLYYFIRLYKDRICFDEKCKDSLESFLFSRYKMYKIVYIHKTVICFILLFSKIIEYIKNFKEDFEDFWKFKIFHKIDFERANKDWYNNEFYGNSEALFFQNLDAISNQISNSRKEEYTQLSELINAVKLRKPVKNCLKFDTLIEVKSEEYCEKEEEMFKDLQRNYPNIINHWSFLRHDPSNPLKIIKPVSSISDNQELNQINILKKEKGKLKISQLYEEKDTLISRLIGHHFVLICYYHNEEDSQNTIRKLARKYQII
ncbi:MAG: HD domain-containing protein [Promethearchaeota archaeon]